MLWKSKIGENMICGKWQWELSFSKRNVFTFWKQIINHKLNLNDQLKYFARDENNQLVSGNCTFCTINKIIDPSEESYKHLFIEH
jgi:hypothetical protein